MLLFKHQTITKRHQQTQNLHYSMLLFKLKFRVWDKKLQILFTLQYVAI